jgi:hypothetical protein
MSAMNNLSMMNNYFIQASQPDHLESGNLPEYLMNDVISKWTLDAWQRSHLSNYYILHWSTPYFLAQSNKASLNHEGIEYLILYHKCMVAYIKEHDQVALSFRKLKSFPYGYVLVKPI